MNAQVMAIVRMVLAFVINFGVVLIAVCIPDNNVLGNLYKIGLLWIANVLNKQKVAIIARLPFAIMTVPIMEVVYKQVFVNVHKVILGKIVV